MDYEEKQAKLGLYIVCLRKLERKCGELNTWQELGQLRSGIISVSNKTKSNSIGIDNIHGTAITIAQETEDLALYVNSLRMELTEALAKMPTAFLREVLESRYITASSIEEIAKRYKYSGRHIRRKIYEGIAELDKNSDYFKN